MTARSAAQRANAAAVGRAWFKPRPAAPKPPAVQQTRSWWLVDSDEQFAAAHRRELPRMTETGRKPVYRRSDIDDV